MHGCARSLVAMLLACCLSVPLFAQQENIDPNNDGSQYAYGENVGWCNAEPLGNGGPGVYVTSSALTGWIWGENIGWINLSCSNLGTCGTVSYGVTNDGAGNLSGYAWGENVGWISFSCENTASCGTTPYGVSIDCDGVFGGNAWAENAGWITFSASAPYAYRVQTSWAPNPITIAPTDLPNAQVGVSYTQTITATGGAGSFTYSLSSGTLPPGLSLDTAGTISGVPSLPGGAPPWVYVFAVKATDMNGCSKTQTYVVLVNDAACPTIDVSPATLSPGYVGKAYSQTLMATGGTDPYSFSIGAGTLPTGLSLDPATGVISGSPTIPGSYIFNIVAMDSNGCTGRQQCTLQICPAITLTPEDLPDGRVGDSYSQTVAASGGTSPFTYAVSSGSLPPGLSLDAGTGLISGTPTTAGTYTFEIAGTDANGCSGTWTYWVYVNEAGCGVIAVTPSTLADGTKDLAYCATLTATGGTPPYSYAVVGTLPQGLSLDAVTGVLSGTPTTTGIFPFWVIVTDSSAPSCSAHKAYSLRITTPLFTDHFDAGALPSGWDFQKPEWSESGSFLVGDPTGRKAIAVACFFDNKTGECKSAPESAFTGCQDCNVEASVTVPGGPGNVVWVIGWYTGSEGSDTIPDDKPGKYAMELLIKEEKDRIIVKERFNGMVIVKKKRAMKIDPGDVIGVQLSYDSTENMFTVSLRSTDPCDSLDQVISFNPVAEVPSGTVVFKTKEGTASFDYVLVTQ
jgi:hypothetical protein